MSKSRRSRSREPATSALPARQGSFWNGYPGDQPGRDRSVRARILGRSSAQPAGGRISRGTATHQSGFGLTVTPSCQRVWLDDPSGRAGTCPYSHHTRVNTSLVYDLHGVGHRRDGRARLYLAQRRGSPAQAAEWAGHSVAVLLKVYAKCIDGQGQIPKRRIEGALRESDDAQARGLRAHDHAWPWPAVG